MATIEIVTTEEERQKVLDALASEGSAVIAMSRLAKLTGLSESRTRYAVLDLVDAGRVERIAHKAFNKHYVRYSYKIIK